MKLNFTIQIKASKRERSPFVTPRIGAEYGLEPGETSKGLRTFNFKIPSEVDEMTPREKMEKRLCQIENALAKYNECEITSGKMSGLPPFDYLVERRRRLRRCLTQETKRRRIFQEEDDESDGENYVDNAVFVENSEES